MFRSCAAPGKGESRGWQPDLGRLSGGERTLVSLALVLSVIPTSCRHKLVALALVASVKAPLAVLHVPTMVYTMMQNSMFVEFSGTADDVAVPCIGQKYACERGFCSAASWPHHRSNVWPCI